MADVSMGLAYGGVKDFLPLVREESTYVRDYVRETVCDANFLKKIIWLCFLVFALWKKRNFARRGLPDFRNFCKLASVRSANCQVASRMRRCRFHAER